jgi:hypothetical protein
MAGSRARRSINPFPGAGKPSRQPTILLHRSRRSPKLRSVQTEPSSAPDLSRCRRRQAWQALTIAILVAAVAGCVTEAGRKKRLLERIQPPQPVLAATTVYGGGILKVESWLGPSVRLKKGDEKSGTAADEGHRGHLRPQSDTPGGSMEQFDDPFEQGSNNFSSQEIEEMYGRANYDYILAPRLALTFRFTNTGPKPVTFTIADVNSNLGNFAPRPETLTVEPGQSGSVDPMLSNLANNFEGLDVTLTVKIGGKKETQTLNLHPVQLPPAAPDKN